MRSKTLLVSGGAFAVASAILLAGCGKSQQTAGSGPIEVGIYTVKAQPVELTTDLPGRTTAFRIAEVRPQVGGIVTKRLFTEGADVKQGQQLYQIDAASYDAKLNKVNANMLATKNLAERYERLRETNAISKQQYDDAQSAWKQAQADVKMAKTDLTYTRVLSPISGRIGRSLVTEGALVTSGQTQALSTIQQLDPIYVDVTRPVAEILKMQKDLAAGRIQSANGDKAKVRLTLEDGSVYPLDGTLKLSEVTVDQGTGSVTLRAVFPNPKHQLLPGMFVHAKLKEGIQKAAKLVPQQAVTRDSKGDAAVWVVDAENKVAMRPIQTLRTVGNAWLVGAGLEPGDKVVTEGLQNLRPGLEVTPTEAKNVNLVTDLTATAKAN